MTLKEKLASIIEDLNRGLAQAEAIHDPSRLINYLTEGLEATRNDLVKLHEEIF